MKFINTLFIALVGLFFFTSCGAVSNNTGNNKIRGTRITDTLGSTVYRIDGDRITDTLGSTVYRIDGDRITDTLGSTVYRIE